MNKKKEIEKKLKEKEKQNLIEAEKELCERLQSDKMRREQSERNKVAREKITTEIAEKKFREEKERLEKEKKKQEKRQEKSRIEAERKIAEENTQKEKEKQEKERQRKIAEEKIQKEKEKQEKERQENIKKEQERLKKKQEKIEREDKKRLLSELIGRKKMALSRLTEEAKRKASYQIELENTYAKVKEQMTLLEYNMDRVSKEKQLLNGLIASQVGEIKLVSNQLQHVSLTGTKRKIEPTTDIIQQASELNTNKKKNKLDENSDSNEMNEIKAKKLQAVRMIALIKMNKEKEKRKQRQQRIKELTKGRQELSKRVADLQLGKIRREQTRILKKIAAWSRLKPKKKMTKREVVMHLSERMKAALVGRMALLKKNYGQSSRTYIAKAWSNNPTNKKSTKASTK